MNLDSFSVVVFYADSTNLDLFICEGDSLFLGGNYQNTPGVYIDTLTTSNGCDSIIFSNLDLYLKDSTYVEIASCNPVEIRRLVIVILSNDLGCDSLVFTTTLLSRSDTIYLDTYNCNPTEVGLDTSYL